MQSNTRRALLATGLATALNPGWATGLALPAAAGAAGAGPAAGVGRTAAQPSAGDTPRARRDTRTSLPPARDGARGNRLLVVFEMSGGNDGLNTVVPYADDIYHRLRPRLALKPARVRRLDDHHGLNPGMAGFERLYKDGQLAIVHGCGYDDPSFSHFASMAFWHTAAPHSGEATGWLGRLADHLRPDGAPNLLVNVAATQSLAVRSQRHVPVVFDDPERFVRGAFADQRELIDRLPGPPRDGNPARRFVHQVAAGTREASQRVREACAAYRTPVDYGLLPLDLHKVAALIHARFPARIYHVAYRHNAFDTHVHQAALHQRLLTYTSDAISGFLRDMARIGRADDVVLMAHSEFGRRVAENANLGTDHGTAGPVFVAGKPVRGGGYGAIPRLDDLTADGNLRHTTDFRRVYATLAQGWLGVEPGAALWRGRFEPFAMVG